MSQGRKKSNRNSKKFIESDVTGVVKRYNDTGGYGFITEDITYRDVFFHISAVSKNIRRRGDPIRVGDEVTYNLFLAPKGYRAESVRILNQDVDISDSDDTDNLYQRKESGNGVGNGVGNTDSRRQRGRGRGRGQRSGERGGHRRRDSDDYESDDSSRSHIRSSNGSTWRTRSSSRGSKQTYQQGQTGVKENSPEFKFFCKSCNDYHNSSKEENDTANVNMKTDNASKSFADFDSQRTAFQTNRNGSEFTYPQSSFSFQRTQRGSTGTESNPQPTTGTTGKPYSFFDHSKTSSDPKKGADINKNPLGTGASFPRNGASSQGGSRRTDTNTNKSDTEGKNPDAIPKPKPAPRTYFSFDTKKEDDIRKNPFHVDSPYRTGVSSEGSSKGTQNTTYTTYNTGANKTDTYPNLQQDQRSTTYSYSYADGSNRFGVPLKNTSRESFGSGASKQQMPTRSVPGDGRSAKPAGDLKETNADHVKSTKGTTTDELLNNAKQQTKGTTASKESQSTGSGNTSKADTEKNPSTTLSSFSRARGNTFFRLARDQRFDMVKSISYKSALACYEKAYKWASRDEDLVSAAKNAATTCWRLATLKMATGCASDQKVIHEYFKDALQYFGKAYPKRNCKGEKWAKHLEKSIQDCLNDIRTWIRPKDEDDRIVALTEYLEYLPSCGAKVEGYLYIAAIYFKKGKEALKFDEYENCLGYLKDCRVPLGEAEKMCDNVDPIIRLDVTALKKNVECHEGLSRGL
eukprot:XP_011664515.1 PREDICTED: uncharacterized protein LOC105438425 [Strongylocentrotus purpuratus]